MKIGIVGDIHWSKYSSIVRMRGNEYSYRLENCINSINWAEKLLSNCDMNVYLGDFFDSSELNAEELTALKEIKWNNVVHYFLVGNHDMGINNLSYSSSHIFQGIKNHHVIDKPMSLTFEQGIVLYFIPYILEEEKRHFGEYINNNTDKHIVFSHNDIAGIQMGKFMSKNGFSIADIHENCDLFINGHLHNGTKIDDVIINAGNLTGQNFSEDANVYDHCIYILDTESMNIAVYENPYAMNFYKIDTLTDDFDFNNIKSNAIISIRVSEKEKEHYENKLDNNPNVVASRFIISANVTTQDNNAPVEDLTINHLTEFSKYVLNTLGTSDVVKSELSEVLK